MQEQALASGVLARRMKDMRKWELASLGLKDGEVSIGTKGFCSEPEVYVSAVPVVTWVPISLQCRSFDGCWGLGG